MSPYGVVIPPDPGDENYVGAWAGISYGPCERSALLEHHEAHNWPDAMGFTFHCPGVHAPNAPETPHTPSSGPDAPEPSVGGGDGSEALRGALAKAIDPVRVQHWIAEDGYPSWGYGTTAEITDALLPLVVAYRDQRAAEALREAASFCRTREAAALTHRGDYNDGLASAYDAVADELTDRADELGPRP